jgi:hypothetical protein
MVLEKAHLAYEDMSRPEHNLNTVQVRSDLVGSLPER